MNEQEFKDRTKKLALRIIRLIEALPNTTTINIIGKQLLRSATFSRRELPRRVSRKVCSGRSTQIAIVEEEADESLYWLELIFESNTKPENKPAELKNEMNEIIAMIVASLKTRRSKQIQNQ